jgi:hypothetical protein
MKSNTVSRPNLYECSGRYSVEVLGRTGLLYREGDRSAFVDAEVLAPPAGLLIYRDSIQRWAPPFDTSCIDDAERQRVLRNILDLLHAQDIQVDVL